MTYLILKFILLFAWLTIGYLSAMDELIYKKHEIHKFDYFICAFASILGIFMLVNQLVRKIRGF